jgi:hypothetical protein
MGVYYFEHHVRICIQPVLKPNRKKQYVSLAPLEIILPLFIVSGVNLNFSSKLALKGRV